MSTAVRRLLRRDDQPADGWWTSIEEDVLTSLRPRGASPAEIAASIGVSEPAVCSVVAMLVEEGRIRITRVELT